MRDEKIKKIINASMFTVVCLLLIALGVAVKIILDAYTSNSLVNVLVLVATIIFTTVTIYQSVKHYGIVDIIEDMFF